MTAERQKPVSDEDLVRGVRAGDRALLARAITLIESTRAEHRARAERLLETLLPATGGAHRIGITGVPGVGKSTAIDQLGVNLTAQGHKVAVLAVDPTSSRSGGSILGDKTRMARLGQDPAAFIRPSPTSGTLGGVAQRTRETIALVEAAGFDIVIVETVGVGQSETTVSEMVDVFVVLMLPGAGDELQGIKKGVLEIADIIAINKADGDNRDRASRAAAEYRSALSILTPVHPAWKPPVTLVSGLANQGLDELWRLICEHRRVMSEADAFAARRREQAAGWLHDLIDDGLRAAVTGRPAVRALLERLEGAVRAGRRTPQSAAAEVLAFAGLAVNMPATGTTS
ncbi:MAG: methylmalonyl Co-A mutase-associated GTPase MeaB [Hyphomicrobiaceae bacterium]